MSDAEVVGVISLFCNLVILLVTAIISAKLSALKSFMFENFVTQREFDKAQRKEHTHDS